MILQCQLPVDITQQNIFFCFLSLYFSQLIPEYFSTSNEFSLSLTPCPISLHTVISVRTFPSLKPMIYLSLHSDWSFQHFPFVNLCLEQNNSLLLHWGWHTSTNTMLLRMTICKILSILLELFFKKESNLKKSFPEIYVTIIFLFYFCCDNHLFCVAMMFVE